MPNYLGKPSWTDYRDLRLTCAKDSTLQALHPKLRKAYTRYWSACCAPFPAWRFGQALGAVAAEKMRGNYKSGGLLAKFIKHRFIERQGLSACPYCGLQKNVTTDHYLPKQHFPQYAMFSQNLVPSCSDCQSNGAKGQWFPGYRYQQRPLREPASRAAVRRLLHPYFDKFLSNRIIRVEFEPENVLREIRLVVTAKNRSHQRLVQFHIEKLKLHTAADSALRTYWTSLISQVQKNPPIALGLLNLKKYIMEEMSRVYGECRSLNGIKFVFYCSVYGNSKMLNFLLDRAKQPAPQVTNVLLPRTKNYC